MSIKFLTVEDYPERVFKSGYGELSFKEWCLEELKRINKENYFLYQNPHNSKVAIKFKESHD